MGNFDWQGAADVIWTYFTTGAMSEWWPLMVGGMLAFFMLQWLLKAVMK